MSPSSPDPGELATRLRDVADKLDDVSPLETDRLIYRIAVGALGLTLLFATIGVFVLILLYKGTTSIDPGGLVALGTAALGALAGLLSPVPLPRVRTGGGGLGGVSANKGGQNGAAPNLVPTAGVPVTGAPGGGSLAGMLPVAPGAVGGVPVGPFVSTSPTGAPPAGTDPTATAPVATGHVGEYPTDVGPKSQGPGGSGA
jgi:hypothetical protein